MGIQAELQGGVLNLYVKGVFDINSYDEFNAAYKPYLEQAQRYVIDLREATHIDSAALGLMLLLRQKTGGDDADITLQNASDEVRKILDIAQFNQLFNVK